MLSVAGKPTFQLGGCYGHFEWAGAINYMVKVAFEEGFFDEVAPAQFDLAAQDAEDIVSQVFGDWWFYPYLWLG